MPTAEPTRLGGSTARRLGGSAARRLGGSAARRRRPRGAAARNHDRRHRDARKFPRLRDRIEAAAGTGYNAAPDRSFEFGLAALLEGLQKSPSGPSRRIARPGTHFGPVPKRCGAERCCYLPITGSR
ncbi:TetR/AcrR family transcriptional regulator C-terminal domain-containing protein [Nocardia rhamnosiphila]